MQIRVNRAPVLTLWASVVAERLGFDREEALTLGRAVAGQAAAIKGRAIGLFEPGEEDLPARRQAMTAEDTITIALLGRGVPAVRTNDGIRALDKETPATPASVERYLAKAFGEALEPVRAAMTDLARRYEPRELNRIGFRLYEGFRPDVPAGAAGWGAKGVLDLGRITG